ncbi:MAG: restriction endonuclease subunit S [Flavobacterium sp.]|nr:restriction endonuclease subunit S [Flavobacterium sp.]
MINFKESEIGKIPIDWNYEPLESFFELITYGFTNPMPTTEIGPYMITAKDINDGRIKYESARKTSEDAFINLLTDKSRPKKNDILITKDASIGRVAIVKNENLCINQSVALIRPNKRIRPLFLKYLLEAPNYQKLIYRDASGSTILHIYITRINKMLIAVPSLKEQDEIVKVVHILQEKIELLQAQNKILKTTAKTIFNEWFDKYDISDDLPEGWRIGKLREIVEIKNGFAFKSNDYVEKGVPIVRTTNFKNGSIILDSPVFLTPEKSTMYDSFKLNKFDFLLVMVGASIGKNVITPSHILPALQNQNMWNFKAHKPIFTFYNILALKKLIREQLNSASGSARDFFRKDHFYNVEILIPEINTLEKFNKIAEPMYNKIDFNHFQIQTLIETRDKLLPKLMTGEIRINEFKD